MYRLPRNVTHTGALHVQLSYTPADGDCFLYLLGPVAKGSREWQVCPGTSTQGFLSLVPGRRSSITRCPEVLDQTPTDESVKGDAYYAVVQAASGVSHVRLTGYLPRTRSGSTDTTSEDSFTRSEVPCAVVEQEVHHRGRSALRRRLRRHAHLRRRRGVPPAVPGGPRPPHGPGGHSALAASFEQYVYPYLWEPQEGTDPPESAHRLLALGPLRAEPPPCRAPAGADWYGLQGSFTVGADGPWLPRATYHYVPVLWLAAREPFSLAPAAAGPPATGVSTVGYKATVLIPQNLRLASATAKVRKGRKATLKGTLAVPESAAADAPVHWAASGTRVTVQRKIGAVWITGPRRAHGRGRGLAPQRARAPHHPVARSRPARAGSAGRVLACEAHRRDPLTLLPRHADAPAGMGRVPLSPRDLRTPLVHAGTWFGARFMIELRGFARVDGWSRGRRGRTGFPDVYREWRTSPDE